MWPKNSGCGQLLVRERCFADWTILWPADPSVGYTRSDETNGRGSPDQHETVGLYEAIAEVANWRVPEWSDEEDREGNQNAQRRWPKETERLLDCEFKLIEFLRKEPLLVMNQISAD